MPVARKAAAKRKLLTAVMMEDVPATELTDDVRRKNAVLMEDRPGTELNADVRTPEQLQEFELSKRRDAATRRLLQEELPSWSYKEQAVFNRIKDQLPIGTLYDEARNKYGGDVGRVIGVIRSDIQNLVGDKRSNAEKKPHPPKRAKTEQVMTEQKRGKPAPPVPPRSAPSTPEGSPVKNMLDVGGKNLFDVIKSKMERRRISIEPNEVRSHTPGAKTTTESMDQ